VITPVNLVGGQVVWAVSAGRFLDGFRHAPAPFLRTRGARVDADACTPDSGHCLVPVAARSVTVYWHLRTEDHSNGSRA